jgi:hypothetical protein
MLYYVLTFYAILGHSLAYEVPVFDWQTYGDSAILDDTVFHGDSKRGIWYDFTSYLWECMISSLSYIIGG